MANPESAPYSTLPAGVPYVNWPTNLPDCVESWEESLVDQRVRSQVSVGPPKTRRRYSTPMRIITLSMVVPNKDLVEFRAFYEGSGTGGTGGTDGGYKFFTFVNPYDKSLHYYRFREPPKFKSAGPVTFVANMVWEEL